MLPQVSQDLILPHVSVLQRQSRYFWFDKKKNTYNILPKAILTCLHQHSAVLAAH